MSGPVRAIEALAQALGIGGASPPPSSPPSPAITQPPLPPAAQVQPLPGFKPVGEGVEPPPTPPSAPTPPEAPQGLLATAYDSFSKVPGDLEGVLKGDLTGDPNALALAAALPNDPLRGLGGTMPRIQSALDAIGHALEAPFNLAGNVGRTFINAAPPSYGPGVAGDLIPQLEESPEQKQAREELFNSNISRIANVSGPYRPTTGSAVGDTVADVMAGLVPLERAVGIAKKVATLGKARAVEEAAAEAPALTRQIARAVDEAEDVERSRRAAAEAVETGGKIDPAAVEAAREAQLKTEVDGLGLVGEDELALISMAKPADAKTISKRLLAEDIAAAGVPESFLDLAQKRLLHGPAKTEDDVKRMRELIKLYKENRVRAEELVDQLDPKPIFHGGKLVVGESMRPIGSKGLTASFTSAGVRMFRQGPTGEKVMTAFEQGLFNSRVRTGRAVDRLQQLTGREVAGFGGLGKNAARMSDEEIASLRRTLDTGEAPISAKVSDAADEIRAINTQIAREAYILGVEVRRLDGSYHLFTPLKNFFPHFVNQQLLSSPAGMNRAVSALVKGGMDPIDAERKIAMMLHGQRTGKFGNLEAAREVKLPPQFWETDPLRAFPVYWERAYERLEAIRSFGGQLPKKVDDLAAAVGAEGGDSEFARRFLRQALHLDQGERVAELWSRGVRAWNVFSKFTPLTGMINLSQSTQTAIRTTMRDTARALLHTTLRRQEAAEQALRGGAVKPRYSLFDSVNEQDEVLSVFDDVTEAVAEHMPDRLMTMKSPMQQFGEKVVGRLEKMGEFNLKYLSGLAPTERFNRIVAYHAGRNYAERQVRRLLGGRLGPKGIKRAEVELKELGLDPELIRQAGELSIDDLDRAGMTVVDATQFGAGFHQQPMLAASPLGKVWFQFRTFTFNNGRLIKDEMLRRPTHTTAMLAALGIPVSVGFGLGRRALTGRPDEEVVDDFANVAAASLWLDLWKARQYGWQGTASFFGGPTLGEVFNLTVTGNPADALKRQVPLRGIIPEKKGSGLLPISREELGIGRKKSKKEKLLGN